MLMTNFMHRESHQHHYFVIKISEITSPEVESGTYNLTCAQTLKNVSIFDMSIFRRPLLIAATGLFALTCS